MISRRSLLVGLASMLAAPAIVQASSLMPISSAKIAPPLPEGWTIYAPDSTSRLYTVTFKIVTLGQGEQRALTRVVVDVINRAEIDNAEAQSR